MSSSYFGFILSTIFYTAFSTLKLVSYHSYKITNGFLSLNNSSTFAFGFMSSYVEVYVFFDNYGVPVLSQNIN